MNNKTYLNHADVWQLTCKLVAEITNNVGFFDKLNGFSTSVKVYPIPRGGVPVAYLLKSASAGSFRIVDSPLDADIFIDDIIDSGNTRAKYAKYGKPFFALLDKTKLNQEEIDWVVFPWESDEKSEDNTIVGTIINRLQDKGIKFFANDNISEHLEPDERIMLINEVEQRVDHLLRGLIIDVDNDHNTNGTARRMAKMFINEVFKGRYYPAPNVTDFPNAKSLDEMYTTGAITIRSACSHHFVPIVGKCWIGVIPGEKVIGLSKFNRLVDWIASRPQIQEEMVIQIADYIEQEFNPKGLAVIVEATHMCMTWRGVKEPMEDAKMTNSVMRGVFRENAATRAEFLSLINKGK